MAFTNIDGINLGNILQTIFTKGMLLQLSRSSRDWEFFKKFAAGKDPARELRYLLQTSLGPSRVQSYNSSTTSFPLSQEVTSSEATCYFKGFDVTTAISYELWARAQESMAKYAEPLAKELEASMIVTNRWLGKLMHLDGTGVFGTLGSSAGTLGSDLVTFQLSTGRGWAALFDKDDLFVLKVAAGTASDLRIDTTVAPAFWKVVSKDRKNNTVTMMPLDANYAAHTSLSAITTQAASGSVFYRYGQKVIPNLTSIADYGTASDLIVGLESLAANDGRTLDGIVRSGVVAGTKVDGGAASLTIDMLAELLDSLDIATGDMYSYSQALMSKESNRFIVLGSESDRRFNATDGARRGSKKFTFTHGEHTVDFVTSEFTRKDRVWLLPEGKMEEGRSVLELHLSDVKPVRKGMNDDGFMLEPGNGVVNRKLIGFMNGHAAMLATHPAAIGELNNFTNS